MKEKDNIIKISMAAARVNKGLSQAELAKLMQCSNKTVVNWEKGITKPSLAQLTLFSILTDIPIDNIRLP